MSVTNPFRDFWSTFRFASLAALPATVGGFLFFAVAVGLDIRYAVLVGMVPIALWLTLLRVARARNALGPSHFEAVHPIHTQVLFYSLALAGINAAFGLILGPSAAGAANLAYLLLTPLWWLEIPFFGLWLSLKTGADNPTAALDTALFLSAHKALAKKLLLLLWLPGMLAGFLLPPPLLLPMAAAFWFACPGLVLATFLHPGDSDGKKRPVEHPEHAKFGFPVIHAGAMGATVNSKP